MAQQDLPPVPFKIPVLDDRGYVSQAWGAFFRQLFVRVGGHNAKTNTELDLGNAGSVTTDLIEDDAVTTPKIANDAVTNSKLANMASPSIKGRATTGPGNPEDLSPSQVTAILSLFTATAQGLVPASGGDISTYLRADGQFSEAVVPDGSITTEKLADGATTTQKVSTDGGLPGQVMKNFGSSVGWGDIPLSSASGLSTDDNGNNEINIAPQIFTLVLADSMGTKWAILVTDAGTLYTESGATDRVSDDFKVQKPDLSYAQIGVNADGSLFVDDAPTASVINNAFRLESPSALQWKIAIDDTNAIQTVGLSASDLRLSIVDSSGNIFWQIRAILGSVLQYMKILDASDLAAVGTPPTVTGCLPLAFYDNGTNKRLIFYDGSAWNYVHDNSAV